MNYSIYLSLAAATFGLGKDPAEPSADATARDTLEPIVERLCRLLEEFASKPVSPQATFELEKQIQVELRDLGRAGVEWAYNHIEPSRSEDLPAHIEHDGDSYRRLKHRTPQTVATTFGKVRLRRAGYRSTNPGEPMVFPLAMHLGIVAGATPALAERVAYYQAEAGATQRRTLQRLKEDHGVNWGVKKLREVTGCIAEAMAVDRHEVQVDKLLQMLEEAWKSSGRHKPVLSVGRDGISIGVPVRHGTIFEVASAATVTVLDRRGRRVGTVYLAYMPESKQPTMSEHLTRLVQEVLQRWQQPLPRLCYVTDAGDNETTYYKTVLRRMRHPRTGQRLSWVRVLDYYHASTRLWTMAEALFGSGPKAAAWVRRMQKLLKKLQGIRRVLNSASVLRSRHQLRSNARRAAFTKAYAYLRERTGFMQYALYEKHGLPLGSGVTEAACKTIYTQRLKLSGMRWKKAGAQTILHLRVVLLSGVWASAYERLLNKAPSVRVPPYAQPQPKILKIAA
jgi:hypothetical protein